MTWFWLLLCNIDKMRMLYDFLHNEIVPLNIYLGFSSECYCSTPLLCIVLVFNFGISSHILHWFNHNK